MFLNEWVKNNFFMPDKWVRLQIMPESGSGFKTAAVCALVQTAKQG